MGGFIPRLSRAGIRRPVQIAQGIFLPTYLGGNNWEPAAKASANDVAIGRRYARFKTSFRTTLGPRPRQDPGFGG